MKTFPLPPLSDVFRGMLLILFTVLLFATQDTITKYLARHYPVGMILWARYLVHIVLFLALVLPHRGIAVLRTERLAIQIVRGTLLSCAALFFTLAIKYMALAEATAIAFTSPLLVTVLSVLFLKERMETGRWVAVFFAFAGVLLIIRPGSNLFTWAAFLPLINAFFFSTFQVLTRKLSGLESPYSLVFYPGLVGLFMYSFTLPYAWVVPDDGWHLFLLAVLGALALLSQLIMVKALELAPASRLAPFSYSQLVWTTMYGYLIFGNFPDHWSLIGIGVLIASGIYCANHQRLSEKEARRILLDTPPNE